MRRLWWAVYGPLKVVDKISHRALPDRWFAFGVGRWYICRATEWAGEKLDA